MTLKFEEIFEKKPVKNFLKMLKKEQQIIQQVSKISSIITIVNYDQYQEKDSEKSNRVYNRRATEEQQKDTNNNVNKENNENNTIRVPLKDGTFFIQKNNGVVRFKSFEAKNVKGKHKSYFFTNHDS